MGLVKARGKRNLSQQFIKQMEIVRGRFPRASASLLYMTYKEIIPFQKNIKATKRSPSPKEYGLAHLHSMQQIY